VEKDPRGVHVKVFERSNLERDRKEPTEKRRKRRGLCSKLPVVCRGRRQHPNRSRQRTRQGTPKRDGNAAALPPIIPASWDIPPARGGRLPSWQTKKCRGRHKLSDKRNCQLPWNKNVHPGGGRAQDDRVQGWKRRVKEGGATQSGPDINFMREDDLRERSSQMQAKKTRGRKRAAENQRGGN